MITWLRNEARAMLGRNPTRGDVIGVTLLGVVWLWIAGCILVLAGAVVWALWTGLGWIGMAGLVAFLLIVRTVWTIVNLLADDLRTQTDE